MKQFALTCLIANFCALLCVLIAGVLGYTKNDGLAFIFLCAAVMLHQNVSVKGSAS